MRSYKSGIGGREGLAGIVREVMGHNPKCYDEAFIFYSKEYLNDILTRMMKGDINYMAMLPCNYVAQEHEDELKVKQCA